VSAGYSGRPLHAKLGFKEGMRAVYVNEPEGFRELLGELPDGVSVTTTLGVPSDLIVCFTTSRRVFEQRLKALRRTMTPAGMLWVAWPKKKAAKVETDMTEDVVREVVLPTGLVDTKVCAIDETWSGLRLVVRKELR